MRRALLPLVHLISLISLLLLVPFILLILLIPLVSLNLLIPDLFPIHLTQKLEQPAVGDRETRARTANSTLGGTNDQQIICAIAESRGIAPTVGLAYINLTTTEAGLCQIVDNQTYTKALHKIRVLEPNELLIADTATRSTLLDHLESELVEVQMTLMDRRRWSESRGIEYMNRYAFKEDVEALKVSLEGSYFAICCFAAVSGELLIAFSK